MFVFSVLEKMRTAVGSAQLLISQKFQQFRELCEENLVSAKSCRVCVHSYLEDIDYAIDVTFLFLLCNKLITTGSKIINSLMKTSLC